MKFKLIEDVEMSNEYDSEGNQLSVKQAEFFKNSKVRDSQGRLLVCYHGTKNPGFTEFDPRYAHSQFGAYKFRGANVNYFASNKESAIGYTEIGIERDGNVYACYLNIINPYIVDNETEAEIRSWRNIRDRKIREKQIKYFRGVYQYWQYNEDWDEDTVEDLNSDFYPLGVVFKQDEDDEEYYSLWKVEDNSMWGGERMIIPGYTLTEFFDDSDLYDEMYEHIIGYPDEEDEYWFTTDEIVKYVLLMNREDHTNYDGIIVEDIVDIGPTGSLFTSSGTDVMTLKSSNQIKSIYNKTPTNSNNINESLMMKDGMYVFDTASSLMNFLRNQKKDIRILYDANLDKYFACDGNEYIHWDILEQAQKEGYYHGLVDYQWELDNYQYTGVNGGWNENDEYIDPYLYYIIFSPDNSFKLGDDDYDEQYDTSIGRFLTRECDIEEIDLYDYIKREMK